MLNYRQPTLAEAVENILRPLNSVEFQKSSIEFYRELYGDEFAELVRATAHAQIRKARGKK